MSVFVETLAVFFGSGVFKPLYSALYSTKQNNKSQNSLPDAKPDPQYPSVPIDRHILQNPS